MYIVPVEVKDSRIHGRGVFALKDISKGQVVWKFTPDHDLRFTAEQYKNLPQSQKDEMAHYVYLSPSSGCWVSPPKSDPACFTNHSAHNNLSTKFDAQVSDEPYFIANRYIKAGEELTNNYLEFDEVSENLETDWLQK